MDVGTCMYANHCILCSWYYAVMEDAGSDVKSKRLARLQQQHQSQAMVPTPRAIPISSKDTAVRQQPVAATTAAVIKPTATTPTKKSTEKIASPVKARIISLCLLCVSAHGCVCMHAYVSLYLSTCQASLCRW